MRSNQHVTDACHYHIVWCPKYRRKVLVHGVDERLKQILHEGCLDNGLGQFVQIVTSKAAEAGRHVYKVNSKHTSQICSACGKKGPKKVLSERVHTCIHCGIVLDRDTNAAYNIYTAWKRPTYWVSVCGAGNECVEAPQL